MLKTLMPSRWSFDRTFRYIEWIILGMAVLRIFISNDISGFWQSGTKIVPFVIVFILMSFIYPLGYSLRLKFAYVLTGLLLALVTMWLDLNCEILFYLYIAKACFLLDKSWLISVMILSGCGQFFIVSVKIQEMLAICATTLPTPATNLCDKSLNSYSFLTYLSEFIPIFCFIWFLSRMAISEQHSRQQAEALSQEIEVLAATVERTRIAREIHDTLGHCLTNLQMQLAVAQEFKHRDLALVFESIDSAQELTDGCIEDVSHALRAMRQDNFDFNGTVAELVEKNAYSYNLSIHNQINLPELPLAVGHHLYSILREGLTNIRKHSGASIVKLSGWIENRHIVIFIEDNGCGFNPHQISNGLGLTGMAERVEILGGKLKINSNLDQGTSIQVTIPPLTS
jgi:signal transduction histidine kinase